MLNQRLRGLEDVADRDRGVAGGTTLAEYFSTFDRLPGLRGLWYPGSADNTGAVFDKSNQGRSLTYQGNPQLYLDNTLIPAYFLDGTGDYFSRADEAGLDVLGTETTIEPGLRGLTIGGWFYFQEGTPLASDRGLISKYNPTGNQRSYILYTNGTTPDARFIVSSNGTAVTQVNHTIPLSINTWYFMWGRYKPSTSITICVNNKQTVNTTSIPAAIFNSTSEFDIGAFGGASTSSCLWGMSFLCAAALPDEVLSYLFYRTRVLFRV